MPNLRACRVTLRDAESVSHTVEVSAESLFEAAALALHELRRDGRLASVTPDASLGITIASPAVLHTVAVRTVERWLRDLPRSPRETLRKARLHG